MKNKVSLIILVAALLMSCNNSAQPEPTTIHDTITITKTDTVYIHDTIYTSKNYGNVEKVIIGGQ